MKTNKPTSHLGNLRVIGLLLLAVGSLAGCGGSGGSSSPTDPTPPGAATGNLKIMMIDAPADEICELWVYISELRVKPDGEPPVLLNGDEIGLVELLELRNGPPVELVNIGVEQGRYQFIEILLDEDQGFVVESASEDPAELVCPGDVVALQTPSSKVKVAGGPFDVTANTTITIDFDAKKSLKRKGSASNPKGWQLKPSVSITEIQ